MPLTNDNRLAPDRMIALPTAAFLLGMHPSKLYEKVKEDRIPTELHTSHLTRHIALHIAVEEIEKLIGPIMASDLKRAEADTVEYKKLEAARGRLNRQQRLLERQKLQSGIAVARIRAHYPVRQLKPRRSFWDWLFTSLKWAAVIAL